MSILERDAALRYRRCMYPQSDQTIPSDMFIVAHSLECDDIPGIAWSLLNGWLQNPAEQASVHTLTDAGGTVQGMDYQNVAWHCGGGNQHGSGHEIVGRAGWSPDQWGTASMDKAFRSLASVIARKWVHRTMPHLGITYLPEWLSLTQIAAQNRAGLVTHNDMRLVFGGTTHTDPGPNYPYKKLRDYIRADIALLLGNVPPVVPPVVPTEPDWKFAMSLPGAPDTYAQFCKDIANEFALLLARINTDKLSAAHGAGVAANNVKHGLNYDGTREGK